MARVLFPLPDTDFDVTEVAVPWAVLTEAGVDVVFATEAGATPSCDPLLLSGVVFGQLGAEAEPRQLYAKMAKTQRFRCPSPWSVLDDEPFDGLWLAGGHAPGMRQYLGSAALQASVRRFWESGRPVAAICHGTLVLARAGVLKGRRTSCLEKYMEQAAYFSTAWKVGRYYRTYDAYVEDEVRAAGAQVVSGPTTLFSRGQRGDHRHAFVVEDGAYVSGRWPGDAWVVAERFLAKLGV